MMAVAVDPLDRRTAEPYFDDEYYLSANPDVAASHFHPLDHFLLDGWHAGRNPSRQFDIRYYLETYPDVAAAGINPLLHYVRAGRKEGRSTRRPLDLERQQLVATRASHTEAEARLIQDDWCETLPYAALAERLGAVAAADTLVVSISHDDYATVYGGIQNVIGDEQRAFVAARWRYLHLSPAFPKLLLAQGAPEAFRFSLRLDGSRVGAVLGTDIVALVRASRGQGATIRVVVHHMMGHLPELLADISAAGGGRPLVWGHDFFSYCPSYALMRNGVKFCAAPPPNSAACRVCAYGASRQVHLPRMQAFFAATQPTMLFPSHVALEAWHRLGQLPHRDAMALPLARLVAASDDEQAAPSPPAQPGCLRIGFLGARMMHKGWVAFEELAAGLAHDERYAFYHLGQPLGRLAPGKIRTVPVRVNPENREAMIEAIAEHRIDVVVSWSLWPETFCFSVHEALAAGAFVVAREAAGNVWPAVQANAPGQGCAVADEAALRDLFTSGEIGRLVAAAPRRRGALLLGSGTADLLLHGAGHAVPPPPARPAIVGAAPVLRGGGGVHCFTSATFAYLDRVRVLGETLRRHHPDWTLWLCLVDQEPVGLRYEPGLEDFDHVVRLPELGIPDLERWVFEHDLVELCTAVKGQMLCRLLDRGASKVVYLDPDIAVFDSLAGVESLLDRHPVVLTPHQLEPDSDRTAILDNEIGSLKYGIYNLGFIAVAGVPEGRRFAQWWRDRLLEFCFDDVPSGLFTDQRWCDHVPALFDGVHILRDPGYNVASWNLSRRPISIGSDGAVLAGTRPLRFFHFTKVTRDGQVMLERYSGGRIEVFELLEWYRSRLAAHVVPDLPPGWWAYACYTDGSPIPREHRVTYRHRTDLRERYPNPFRGGAAMFPLY